MNKVFTVNKHLRIDSDESGQTLLVTQDGDTLLLSANVAFALCDHLNKVLTVTITLRSNGRFTTMTKAGAEQRLVRRP